MSKRWRGLSKPLSKALTPHYFPHAYRHYCPHACRHYCPHTYRHYCPHTYRHYCPHAYRHYCHHTYRRVKQDPLLWALSRTICNGC